jgi:hypothetical protein
VTLTYQKTSRVSAKSLAGRKLGELTVIKFLGRKLGFGWWECACSCGNKVDVPASKIKAKQVTSCGCGAKKVKLTKSPLRTIWLAMLSRCKNTDARNYRNYGGRGITVCERWTIFENFRADMGESFGLTLDRVDNDLGYCKSNCRWSSFLEQTRNRRVTIKLTYNSQTKPLAEWADLLKIPYSILYSRKTRLGYSDHDCISKPIRGR